MIGASTALVALLGDPVDHSLSPRMHNAAFRYLGLDWRYLAFRVEGSRFEEALRGLEALGARGANVTVPHKERAWGLAEGLDEDARACGAVNLVLFRRRGVPLWGANTDVPGLRAVLEELPPPRGAGALLLGAGGAARAAARVLAQREGPLWVAARNPERIRDLETSVAGLEGRCRPLAWGDLPPESWDLLVHATPLGLPDRPWDGAYLERLLDRGPSRVLDLVYRPQGPTELEARARERGLGVAGGRRLLLHQGAATLRLLADREVPLAVLERALEGREGP